MVDVTRIQQVPDAFFGVVDNYIKDSAGMYDYILNSTDWEQYTLGNGFKSPRLNKSYGKGYDYSGKVNKEVPMPEYYAGLARIVANDLGFEEDYWNQVLLNYYRNGKDAIGAHSDAERSLGNNPRVLSISLGATRQFILQRRSDKGIQHTLDLHDGQLLIMGNNSQLRYLHSIPKEPHITAGRISITFRHVMTP